jgi:hypothetical protein
MDSYWEGLYRTQGLEDTLGDWEAAESLEQPDSPPSVCPEWTTDWAIRSWRVNTPLASHSKRCLLWRGRN